MNQLEQPKVGEEVVVIETDLGKIKLRLFPEAAPKAVENFKTHVAEGYYNGILFHRVIPDFMIQTGDPTATGRGGESIWKKSFEDEFHPEYRNIVGALSMANAGPNTNGSQFFIVQGSPVAPQILTEMEGLGAEGGYPQEVVEAYRTLGGAFWLDGKHTVFGQVYEGQGVVDAIAGVDRDSMDRPKEDLAMNKVYLEVVAG
ncbi:MAG: peptidylprolyl isomerase [Tissierellia bacterium]|nr:peptidylprolyl isomerase [Tissierellia bacterium]